MTSHTFKSFITLKTGDELNVTVGYNYIPPEHGGLHGTIELDGVTLCRTGKIIEVNEDTAETLVERAQEHYVDWKDGMNARRETQHEMVAEHREMVRRGLAQ